MLEIIPRLFVKRQYGFGITCLQIKSSAPVIRRAANKVQSFNRFDSALRLNRAADTNIERSVFYYKTLQINKKKPAVAGFLMK